MAAAIIAVLLAGLFFALWLWAVAPGRGADFSALEKADYAHRGLHRREAGAPENSLRAFELAARGGFGMEFDVQLTKDRRVVIHHDPTLRRTCGEDKALADLTWEELGRYRLFGTGEGVPLFRDALRLVDGRVPLIIELKGYQPAEELCPLVMAELEGYQGPYCVESFDPRIVRWFRENRPEVCRGQLMERLEKGTEGLTALQAFAGRHLLINCWTRPHFVAYDFHARTTPSLPLARGLLGLREVSWTLRDWEELSAAKALGNLCIFEGFAPEKDAQAAQAAFQRLTAPAGAAVEATKTGG